MENRLTLLPRLDLSLPQLLSRCAGFQVPHGILVRVSLGESKAKFILGLLTHSKSNVYLNDLAVRILLEEASSQPHPVGQSHDPSEFLSVPNPNKLEHTFSNVYAPHQLFHSGFVHQYGHYHTFEPKPQSKDGTLGAFDRERAGRQINSVSGEKINLLPPCVIRWLARKGKPVVLKLVIVRILSSFSVREFSAVEDSPVECYPCSHGDSDYFRLAGVLNSRGTIGLEVLVDLGPYFFPAGNVIVAIIFVEEAQSTIKNEVVLSGDASELLSFGEGGRKVGFECLVFLCVFLYHFMPSIYKRSIYKRALVEYPPAPSSSY